MPNIRENFDKILNSRPVQIASSTLVGLGTGADILSQSQYRHIMPRLIREPAGNFGLSSLPIITIGIVSSILQERGRLTDNPKLEAFGRNLYTWSVIFMVGVETGVESQFINHPALLKENIDDFSMGIIAIVLSTLAINRFRNAHIQDDKVTKT